MRFVGFLVLIFELEFRNATVKAFLLISILLISSCSQTQHYDQSDQGRAPASYITHKLTCHEMLTSFIHNYRYSKDRIEKLWNPEQFSDPLNHDPDNFKYIVTGISESSLSIEDLTNKDYIARAIEQNFSDRQLISSSVITAQNNPTYRNTGLILEALPEHIAVTSIADAGIKNRVSAEELPHMIRIKRGYYPLRSPDEILKRTRGISNEIVLYNVGEVATPKIKGIYLKVDDNQVPYLDDETVEAIYRAAQDYDLPVVLIKGEKGDYR